MHFINSRTTVVADSIDGLLRLQQGPQLARIEPEPGYNIVFDPKHDGNSKVAVICGGGSGHEPAHAGFVGSGMLAAAVCGDVFASPTVDAVLQAILAVTGNAGCLLIIKNYTGDRLNFGLAAEQAKSLGLDVEVVIVGDDIAIPKSRNPRGLAGTLLVQKIAGDAAAQGEKLSEVKKIAQEVSAATVTLGVSLSSCNLLGRVAQNRIPIGKAEIGLGIHGEPGVELIDYADISQTVAVMIDKLQAAVGNDDSYIALINNLGGTTPLEMGIVCQQFLSSALGASVEFVVGPAPLMTALDMHGFSISLLPLKPIWKLALVSPVGARAWPGVARVSEPRQQRKRSTTALQKLAPSQNPEVRHLLETACRLFIDEENQLNTLDLMVGDGDTGTTFAAASRRILSEIDDLPLADHSQLFFEISVRLSQVMGGSSGVLLAIMFAAAGRASQDRVISPVQAMKQGVYRMMDIGGAGPGDRTLIDALLPALDELVQGRTMEQAAAAARHGADTTKNMTSARAGRSSYLAESSLIGKVDPGAEAVAMLFSHWAALE